MESNNKIKQPQYILLSHKLKDYREHYLKNPSNKALEKEIKRIDKILKDADRQLGRFTTPNGNYKSII